MATLRNPARERMEKDEPALGAGLRITRHTAAAKLFAVAGFDFLFIDLEHSAMSVDTATQIAVAANDAGIAPLVRVPELDHRMAARVLDAGAMGTVMPHVNSAEEAKAIVREQKFPPQGRRSAGGGLVHYGFGPVNETEALAELNRLLLTTVMLETKDAVKQADEIAAVDGVDVVMIGTGDLTTELGLRGQPEHPDIKQAYEIVLAACKKHGKFPGMGGVGMPDVINRYIDMGMRFILAGNDVNFMAAAGAARTKALREGH